MKQGIRKTESIIRNSRGSMLLHLVIILVVAGVIGTAMISLMSTSTNQQVYSGTAHNAQLLAESGFRYLSSQYKAESGEINKNNSLKTLNGKTLILDNDDGRFSFDIRPYFFTARSDHAAGSTTLQCEFPGLKPDDMTLITSGTLAILKGSKYDLYTYSSRTGDNVAFDFTGIANAVDGSSGLSASLSTGATIQSVLTCETKVLASGSGNSLTVYGANQLMAQEDGVFEIVDNNGEFKDATGTRTEIFMYASRSGTTLYDISVFNDHGKSFSLNLDTNSRIVVHRSARIESTGTIHAGQTDETNRTFTVMAGLGDTLVTVSASDLIYDDPNNVLTDLIDGATVVGDATTVSNGKIGDAMVFDGDMDYVRLNDDPALDLTTEGSIGAWIKISAFDNNFAGIIRKGGLSDDSDLSYALKLISKDRLRLEVYDASSSYTLTSSTRLDLGIWYHVAGTWGPAGMYIYIDGQEDAYDSATPVARVTTGTVQIGAQLDESFNPGQGYFAFNGIIDEVFIYNTQEDLCGIRDIYSNPCNTGCDAIAYYPFFGTYEDVAGENKTGDDTLNATASGSTFTADRFGCPDKAVDLRLWDHVEVPEESPFDFSGPFTVAVWVRVGTWSMFLGDDSFVAKGTNSFRLQRYNRTDNANFGTTGLNRVDTRGNDNLDDGNWHHVVGVYNGSQKVLYVDGARDAFDNVNKTLTLNNSRVRMGSLGLFSVFTGEIDDVGFWDKALSQEEIENIYNGLRTDPSMP